MRLGSIGAFSHSLSSGATLETHAKDLGLALSDETLIKGVEADPDFQGRDGKFSKQGFDALLRQIGLSERAFLNLRRQDELKAALVGSFIKGQTVPKPLFDLMHAYNDEKRVIEWIKIDPEVVSVPEPTEAKLKEVYETDKAKYMTPEYRKVQVLTLGIDDLKKQMTVSDDDIAKAYEASKDTYNTPEQRRVQQIAFKDKATAEAALKALRDGTKTFGDVAKETGAKDTDVDLGLINKKALIDPKVADVAFSLEKDKYSDVIEGGFATVILRVTQIEPGATRTLADVKDEVKDKLATEKAKTELQNKHDEVEDERLAGKTLKEVADQAKLTFKEIPATDATGLNPEGKPVLETPDLMKIIGRAFAPEGNTDDTAIELADGGFAWVNVISTDAPKQKTFEQVKDQVKDNFVRSERQRLIDELAKKLTDRVNAGEPMTALEAQAKNKVGEDRAANAQDDTAEHLRGDGRAGLRSSQGTSQPRQLARCDYRDRVPRRRHYTGARTIADGDRCADTRPAGRTRQSNSHRIHRRAEKALWHLDQRGRAQRRHWRQR